MIATARLEDDAIIGNVDDLVQTLRQAGCTPEQVQAFIRRYCCGDLTRSPLRFSNCACREDYAE